MEEMRKWGQPPFYEMRNAEMAEMAEMGSATIL